MLRICRNRFFLSRLLWGGPGLTRKPRNGPLCEKQLFQIGPLSWVLLGSSELGKLNCQNHAFFRDFGVFFPPGRLLLPRQPRFLEGRRVKTRVLTAFWSQNMPKRAFWHAHLQESVAGAAKMNGLPSFLAENVEKRVVLATWAPLSELAGEN